MRFIGYLGISAKKIVSLEQRDDPRERFN